MAKAKRVITLDELPPRLRLVFDVRTDKHPDIVDFYIKNQTGYSEVVRDALSLYLLIKQRTGNQSFSQMIGTVSSALSGIPVSLEIPPVKSQRVEQVERPIEKTVGTFENLADPSVFSESVKLSDSAAITINSMIGKF